MNTEMQRRAFAARDAHLALSDLKRLIDEATRTTHDLELEAFHLALSTRAPLREGTPKSWLLQRVAWAFRTFEGHRNPHQSRSFQERNSIYSAFYF